MEQSIFLIKHNFLNDKQYGFRQMHSMYMTLLETVYQISEAVDKTNDSTVLYFL